MTETNPDDPINMSTTDSGHVGQFTGLSKREYFAAMALQGILSNRELQVSMAQDRSSDKRDCSVREEWANEAVKQSDYLVNQLNSKL